ncbi:uncharacterized protein LOC131427306 [Malaya genurostris]|uniref:uncharacterized protein LOC131427306 n=1 Tax=Malaya genurostris TaxID=325434 RepID=UPI0026F3D7BA|nr:uncharacterized protein LOC131427306 [Malaya genurostris]XP_058446355.1 uncharacterized protein LOC131427306 [Malaya genurostris]
MGLARVAANLIKVPDAVDEMAPALTEPLSQSKLSSSATSGASPRTGVETSSQQEVPSSVSTDSGTGTVSTNPSETDLVLTDNTAAPGIAETVDDIQNNNNNNNDGQLLKIDSDSGKDLIELALEQLHRDEAVATAAESAIAGVSTPTDTDISQAVIDQIVQVAASTSETATASEVQGDLQQLDSQSSIISSSSTTMGLQKDYLKDNPDMEQMLGELASTSDMELLQVFKSLEGNPSGDGLCAELAGGLSLFNDVDVVNMYEEVTQATPTNKDHERLEMHAEIVKRQSQMQRKYDFLIRRLNKLQARYMGQHVSEEIAGLFEYSQRYWKKKDKENAKGHGASSSTVSPTSLIPDIIPYQPHPPSSSDKLKPISANAMKTFAKRLEGIATTQCSTQTKRIYSNRYFQGTTGGPSPMETSSSSSAPSSSIPKFDDTVIDQLEQTAGLLHSELHQVQCTIDSEATVSSSGGESADEMVLYNNLNQQSLTIAKRAAWRWAKDRASVAARWTWLLAQISDLEYRIRQHNELYNKIKINKGAVTLESAQSQPPQPPSQQSVNGYRGTLPGNSKPLDDIHDTINVSSCSGTAPNGAYDQTGGSCRTRPFHRNGFRKRKLLQTANLHTISKKAARPSTVKCGCAWPLQPCALCTGRQDPTAPRDLPDTMPASERVALLDPCFHPVLSFPEDVSQGIHFEAIMRIPEWQNKMIRSTAKSLSRSAGISHKSSSFGSTSTGAGGTLPSSATPAFLSSGDEAVPLSGNKKYGPDGKRKYNKHNKLHSSQELTNHKLKKSKSRRNLILTNTGSGRRKSSIGYHPSGSSHYGPTGHGATPGGSSNKYYKSSSSKYRKSSNSSVTAPPGAAGAIGGGGGGGGGSSALSRYNSGGTVGSVGGGGASSGLEYMDSAGLHHDGTGSGSSRSKNSSPTPNHHRNERKSRPSYDIDNIVIPYSMAAANKVELLPYKEIVTPKWRIVDENEESVDPDSETSETSQLTKTGSSGDNAVPDVKPSETANSTLPLPTKPPAVSDLTQSLTEGHLIVLPAIDEEDISEETILIKHDRALQDERKKFRTYMKFPWSRPRANRRTDSRAESSGANTPDPTSPAPPTPLVDIESNTSPACPSTPLMPLDTQELSETNVLNALNQSLNKKERRRTVSTKIVRDEIQRSTSPDIKEAVPPYESLQFPLPDDLYDEMIRTMPSDHLTMVEDAINKLTRPNRPNNNLLLANRNNLNLAPSSSGHSRNPLSSNLSTTSTTLSATENDLDDLDCNDNDDELLQAKKVENQIIMEKLLKSCDENRMFVGVRQVLDDDDPMDDEETDTGESLFVEEDDPNDPEWYDRPGRGRT